MVLILKREDTQNIEIPSPNYILYIVGDTAYIITDQITECDVMKELRRRGIHFEISDFKINKTVCKSLENIVSSIPIETSFSIRDKLDNIKYVSPQFLSCVSSIIVHNNNAILAEIVKDFWPDIKDKEKFRVKMNCVHGLLECEKSGSLKKYASGIICKNPNGSWKYELKRRELQSLNKPITAVRHTYSVKSNYLPEVSNYLLENGYLVKENDVLYLGDVAKQQAARIKEKQKKETIRPASN
jgi:hypothetical protein